MSSLKSILATYRALSQTEREKGSYFEELAEKDKRVLFIVPSLNLLAQTLTEWTQESAIPLRRGPASQRARQGHLFRTDSALT